MYYWRRTFLILLVDIALINLSMVIALLLRFDGNIPAVYWEKFLPWASLAAAFLPVFFSLFGLYRRAWEYASIGELLAITLAVTAGSAVTIPVLYLLNGFSFPIPRSVLLIHTILQIVLIGGSRIAWRLFRDYGLKRKEKGEKKRVLIFGAGDAGVLVAKELKRHYHGKVQITGFGDDDPGKKKMLVHGICVLGTRKDIPELVEKHQIREVIIAMPSAEARTVRELMLICQEAGVKVKILPGVYDLIEGKIKVSEIREVEVEDLLGREPVQTDLADITYYIRNQTVLVTGGGGSIGSELCRQVCLYHPEALLILDSCENNVYEIDMELRRSFPGLKIISLVKDIRDRKMLLQVFEKYRPQVIFHAAAHKHVPMMEYNPEDALKNNVSGTYHVARMADMFGAKKFVLISTDKAVNPASFMGASKRLAEMVIQYMNAISETSFAVVRFGNVLGSKGSVIPLFKRQIAGGGPVTVTHSEMVRYFMTIPEAVQLVIQAGAMAKGGEIFLLDMGEPVRIMDLAKSLIRLSGFEPGKDIEIKVTGTRPGEKLYEELLTAEEGVTATAHKRIFAARPGHIQPEKMEDGIIARIMGGRMPENEYEALRMIREFLPEFRQGTWTPAGKGQGLRSRGQAVAKDEERKRNEGAMEQQVV